MTLPFKHIGLLIGVVLTFVSFLFFGRQQGTYQVLLICGLVTTLIFYLTILFGKGHLKTKIFWTVVVVYIISKSDKGIYYGLWGFLDVRLGITYWTGIVKPDNKYQH